MAKTIIWYETRGIGTTTHKTEKEAKNEILNAKKGYPDNKNMTEENRKYWKSASKKMKVVKITHLEESIK